MLRPTQPHGLSKALHSNQLRQSRQKTRHVVQVPHIACPDQVYTCVEQPSRVQHDQNKTQLVQETSSCAVDVVSILIFHDYL